MFVIIRNYTPSYIVDKDCTFGFQEGQLSIDNISMLLRKLLKWMSLVVPEDIWDEICLEWAWVISHIYLIYSQAFD